jgi:hypothetical protein
MEEGQWTKDWPNWWLQPAKFFEESLIMQFSQDTFREYG